MSGPLRGLLVVAAVGLLAAVVFLGGGTDRLTQGPSRAEEPAGVEAGAAVSAAAEAEVERRVETRAASDFAGGGREPAGGEIEGAEAETASRDLGFVLAGVVLLEDGVELSEEARVTCLEYRRGAWVEVAGADVEADGTWEPIEVALREDGEYLAQFAGGDCLLREVSLGTPKDGETREVEFVAAYGNTFWCDVRDETDEKIPDPVGFASWVTEGGRRVERRYRLRPDGYLALTGLPEGVFRPRIEAPGFVTQRLEEAAMPERDPALHIINMVRAGGGIVGRCVADGEPVADFDLVCLEGDSVNTLRLQRLRGSDGSFRVDGLPATMLGLAAYAPDGRRSPLVRVIGSPSEPVEVVLELEPAGDVRGRVVDAKTGEPLDDATVQPTFSLRAADLAAVGEATRVDSSGDFRLRASGGTYLRVEAPGHARLSVRVPDGEGDVDLGELRLVALHELRLQLLSETVTDFRDFTVHVSLSPFDPRYPFDRDGFVAFEAPPRYMALQIIHPERLPLTVYIDPREDGDWTREIRLDDGRRVSIDFVAPEGGSLPPPMRTLARVTYVNERGEKCERNILRVASPLVLDGVLGDWMQVEILDWEGTGHGGARFELTEEPEQHFVLQLGGFGATVFVHDPEGRPVAGAELFLTSRDGSQGYSDVVSDPGGRARFAGIDRSELLLRVRHPDLGARVLPVDLRSATEPIDVELGSGHRLAARFTRRGLPESGVKVALIDPNYWLRGFPALTDAEGHVEWRGLDDGPLTLVVDAADLWSMHLPLELDGDLDLDLGLYGLGGLRLEVRNVEGLPVAGTTLELVHQELGEGPADWAARQLLETPPGGWATDAAGVLVLEKLPEGSYAWSAANAAGERVGGRVQVVAGETRAYPLVLP